MDRLNIRHCWVTNYPTHLLVDTLDWRWRTVHWPNRQTDRRTYSQPNRHIHSRVQKCRDAYMRRVLLCTITRRCSLMTWSWYFILVFKVGIPLLDACQSSSVLVGSLVND